MNNKYGLICVSKILQEEDAKNSFSFLTKKEFLKTIESESDKKAIKKVEDLIIHNLKLTQKIIGFCRSVNIDHYRLNNSIFGLTQDPSVDLDLKSLPSFELIQEELREVGRSSITNTITLSVQPDIFCKIYDEDDVLCASSADQLNFYGWMLDTMGMQKNPRIFGLGMPKFLTKRGCQISQGDAKYPRIFGTGVPNFRGCQIYCDIYAQPNQIRHGQKR